MKNQYSNETIAEVLKHLDGITNQSAETHNLGYVGSRFTIQQLKGEVQNQTIAGVEYVSRYLKVKLKINS